MACTWWLILLGVCSANPPGGAGPLEITTSSLVKATQYSAYSATVSASGNAGAITWSLVSQTGTNYWQINSATGVISATGTGISGAPYDADSSPDVLVVKATDSASSVEKTLSITVNQAVPPGAEAKGYTTQLYYVQPRLADVTFGSYLTDGGTKFDAGAWYSGIVPLGTLFSTNSKGVLTLVNTGGTGGACMTGEQRAQVASALPLIQLTNGGAFAFSSSQSSNSADHWIGLFFEPTEHNLAKDDIDPTDRSLGEQWFEADVWEGGAEAGFYGNAIYWNGTYPNYVHYFSQNSYTDPSFDSTVQHLFEEIIDPNGTVTWFIDGVETGTNSVASSAGSRLSWILGQHFYPQMQANAFSGASAYRVYLNSVSVYH
jgi:hypothetical protein